MNQTLKQTLLNNLSVFGLNPEQWKLQKSKENTYWIQNKQIPSWYFRGVSTSSAGKTRWEQISLVSL